MSELTKLAKNTKLKEIDVRLNPVSVMSTEYRLLLVHALPSLAVLGKIMSTEPKATLLRDMICVHSTLLLSCDTIT